MIEWAQRVSMSAYAWLLPFGQWALALSIFVLLPLAIFRRTRAWSGAGLVISSYVVGITTWFLGATVTFAALGWIGLLIGLVIFGVAVVPLGIFAAFFSLGRSDLGWTLLTMVVITFGMRYLGSVLAMQRLYPTEVGEPLPAAMLLGDVDDSAASRSAAAATDDPAGSIDDPDGTRPQHARHLQP